MKFKLLTCAIVLATHSNMVHANSFNEIENFTLIPNSGSLNSSTGALADLNPNPNPGSNEKPQVKFETQTVRGIAGQEFRVKLSVKDNDTTRFIGKIKSSDNNVVSETMMTVTGSNENNLFLVGRANNNGTATVTLTIFDKNGYSGEASFKLVVGGGTSPQTGNDSYQDVQIIY